jgi:2-polyprenyl-6-hydroxyphenyl methylase/3-demethylubiquinone-9 3-methyltransferase
LSGESIGFSFGENWRKFLERVDEQRLRDAEESLDTSFCGHSFEGRTFIDAGCGSGVFSYAAHRLGVRSLLSVDIDPNSIECARILRERAGRPDNWSVQQGSLLDPEFVGRLGTADVVYSWGVLHHTGQIWRAIESTMTLVNPGGLLCLALYRPPRRLELHMRLKRTYNRSPRGARLLLAALYFVVQITLNSAHQRAWPWSYVRDYGRQSRGMSLWRDVEDWLGGLPCEFTEAPAVETFASSHGFSVENTFLAAPSCNNEYLLRRKS